MTPIFDTHCHLDFDLFDDDRDQIIQRAVDNGVSGIIVPAIDLEGCRQVIQLAERYAPVFAAVGVHPNSSATWDDEWIQQLRKMASHQKVVAIGEIGLDYYRDNSPHNVQKRALALQLNLAEDLGLPIILHNRESGEDLLEMLTNRNPGQLPLAGVFHSFSSNWGVASKALELGFYIGFTGPITFKNADSLREIAKKIPLDRILVETDSPFLAPQKRRGKRNEPANVTEVVDQLASLHGQSFEEVSRITTQNAIQLFSLDLPD